MAELQHNVEELESRLAAAQDQIDILLSLAERWEFQYLNHFYVENTKRLLYRLVQRGQVTVADFIGMTQLRGIAAGQNLLNTVNALREHGVIEFGQDSVAPTDKARRFLEQVGFRESPSVEMLNALIRAAIERRAAEGSPPPPPPPPPQ